MTNSSADPVEDSPATAGSSSAGRRRLSGPWAFARDVVVILVIALVASMLIKAFLVRTFYIPSSSMEETLQINDRIIVNELAPRFFPVDRGDIVVFKDPGGWLGAPTPPPANPVVGAIDWVLTMVGISASDSTEYLVKRIIGMPGDTVACCDATGSVTVNGVPLDEPYVSRPEGEQASARITFDVTVPEGHVWVMGDNRWNSADSTAHIDDPTGGFVPIDEIVGVAFVISWPIQNWRWLDGDKLTFVGIDDPVAGALRP